MERQAGRIQVSNLCWRPDGAGNPVLDGIGLTLEAGRFYGILGQNGSGKTSLLRHLLRLLDSKRAVSLDGAWIETYKQKALARKMSYVPQDTNMEADFTVEEVVRMGRAPYFGYLDAPKKADIEAVREAMRLTNCAGFSKKSILALSGGERQRVAAARAIAQEAEWIFLDEPVSHLDLRHQLELMGIMKRLCREKGVGVAAVLHNVNLALWFCDHLLCMKHGRLVCAGDAKAMSKESLEAVYDLAFEEERTKDGRRYFIPVLKTESD